MTQQEITEEHEGSFEKVRELERRVNVGKEWCERSKNICCHERKKSCTIDAEKELVAERKKLTNLTKQRILASRGLNVGIVK